MNIKEDEFSEVRYQDLVSHDQFSVAVNSGPFWYRVANKFRTPYNHDLVERLNGPMGSFYTSSDGGNWWFKATFRPLKISWDKFRAYRVNEADPFVERRGFAPYARMIPKSFPVVEWPPASQMADRVFTSYRVEYKILSPKQALDAGYKLTSTESGLVFSPSVLPDGLSGSPSFDTFPHNVADEDNSAHWEMRPIEPIAPGPAPVISDYQYTTVKDVTVSGGNGEAPSVSVTQETKTLPLFQRNLAHWQEEKNKYDEDYSLYVQQHAHWSEWRQKSCAFVRIRDGRVRNILSVTKFDDDKYLHTGLSPFFNEAGLFLGWGAIQEKRVVFTETLENSEQEVFGAWIPIAAGITMPISKWNETGNDVWVEAPIEFDFTKDPRFQGPF